MNQFKVIENRSGCEKTVYAISQWDGDIMFLVYERYTQWHWENARDYRPIEEE